jgi:glycosyltransferase involved in cell wall biosynthesis
MNQVAVSVCIPTYRNPELLARALASVASQTFTDYEIVITDDSPDDSVESVVARFAPSAPIIYGRNSERLGSPENWNHCVSLASGDLVKLLHHDDWLTSRESLGDLVELMYRTPDAALGFGATAVSNPDGSLQRIHRAPMWWLAVVRRNPRWLFPWNKIGSPSATIYRRSHALRYDPRLKWVVDIDFYIRTLLDSPTLAFINRVCVATTNGLPTQVTAQSLGNRNVELFEWTYLFGRVFEGTGAQANPLQIKFMWDLFAKHDLADLAELRELLGDCDVPTTITRMVQLRHALRKVRYVGRRKPRRM